jgi:hypothetical protein
VLSAIAVRAAGLASRRRPAKGREPPRCLGRPRRRSWRASRPRRPRRYARSARWRWGRGPCGWCSSPVEGVLRLEARVTAARRVGTRAARPAGRRCHRGAPRARRARGGVEWEGGLLAGQRERLIARRRRRPAGDRPAAVLISRWGCWAVVMAAARQAGPARRRGGARAPGRRAGVRRQAGRRPGGPGRGGRPGGRWPRFGALAAAAAVALLRPGRGAGGLGAC